MSATLYVEGPDRDVLLAAILAEHGDAAVVTSVQSTRHGGVGGFFAREMFTVAYQLTEQPAAAAPASQGPLPSHGGLGDLLELADSADGPPPDPLFADILKRLADQGAPSVATAPVQPAQRPEPPAWPDIPVTLSSTVDEGPAFTELLGQLSAEVAAIARMTQPEAPFLPPPTLRPLVPAARPERPVPSARQRLDMLARLRGVGVPMTAGPEAGESNLYRAVEQVVDGLPPAPPLPLRAGDVVVLVGTPEQLSLGAEIVTAAVRVPADAVWWAGNGRHHAVTGPLDAAERATELRTANTPAVVAVPVEDACIGQPQSGWSAQVVAALRPTAVWAAVDAGRKVEDLRAELDPLGHLDGLLVFGAARTRSPATVWDLDVPIGYLDGRPATAGTWSGLLFDALRAGADQ